MEKMQLCNKQQVDLYIAVYNYLVQYMRYTYVYVALWARKFCATKNLSCK